MATRGIWLSACDAFSLKRLRKSKKDETEQIYSEGATY
jgi:hypothetical protein